MPSWQQGTDLSSLDRASSAHYALRCDTRIQGSLLDRGTLCRVYGPLTGSSWCQQGCKLRSAARRRHPPPLTLLAEAIRVLLPCMALHGDRWVHHNVSGSVPTPWRPDRACSPVAYVAFANPERPCIGAFGLQTPLSIAYFKRVRSLHRPLHPCRPCYTRRHPAEAAMRRAIALALLCTAMIVGSEAADGETHKVLWGQVGGGGMHHSQGVLPNAKGCLGPCSSCPIALGTITSCSALAVLSYSPMWVFVEAEPSRVSDRPPVAVWTSPSAKNGPQ